MADIMAQIPSSLPLKLKLPVEIKQQILSQYICQQVDSIMATTNKFTAAEVNRQVGALLSTLGSHRILLKTLHKWLARACELLDLSVELWTLKIDMCRVKIKRLQRSKELTSLVERVLSNLNGGKNATQQHQLDAGEATSSSRSALYAGKLEGLEERRRDLRRYQGFLDRAGAWRDLVAKLLVRP